MVCPGKEFMLTLQAYSCGWLRRTVINTVEPNMTVTDNACGGSWLEGGLNL